MNSMYALIDARRRDLATLRAIGFASSGIAVALMIEALLLAAPGAIAGVLIPWLIFNGSAANFVGLNFSLAVTLHLAALGVGSALGMGLVGGFAPALRAAGMPIAAGLRGS